MTNRSKSDWACAVLILTITLVPLVAGCGSTIGVEIARSSPAPPGASENHVAAATMAAAEATAAAAQATKAAAAEAIVQATEAARSGETAAATETPSVIVAALPTQHSDAEAATSGPAEAMLAATPSATDVVSPPIPAERIVFEATGAMNSPRSEHTATRLLDEKVLVVSGEGSAELYDPDTGSWSTTGSMGDGHSGHTATLLSGGRVLVVGGWPGSTTTELYDPETGTWSSTGTLNIARRGCHTATLLGDGKLLVVGASMGHGERAEVFDPYTSRWSISGDMSTDRCGHTATLLPSGKVLVAGGLSGGNALSSAELYDPDTGTWSTTGSMSTARQNHSSTLLRNGMVLAAGGHEGGFLGATLNSAELYDADTGTWRATGRMKSARYRHAAVLLGNGRVLVAGGATSFAPTLQVMPAVPGVPPTGAEVRPGFVMQAGPWDIELYDPDTGTWSTAGSIDDRSTGYTLTLLRDGRVLVAGGSEGDDDTPLSSTEVGRVPFSEPAPPLQAELTVRTDPTPTPTPTGPWLNWRDQSYQPLIVPLNGGEVGIEYGNVPGVFSPLFYESGDVNRSGGVTGLIGSRTVSLRPGTTVGPGAEFVLEVKIEEAGLWLARAGRYDDVPALTTASPAPEKIVFEATGVMNSPGASQATLLHNDKVLVVKSDGSCEVYDPDTGTWSATGNMIASRARHTSILLDDGRVLAVGATLGDETPELYDPETGTWSATGSLNTPRENATATLLSNGMVLVVGGTRGARESAELYDPDTGAWSVTGDMKIGRWAHSATLLDDGRVLVAGGQIYEAASAELYDPQTGTWTATGDMNIERSHHTATLLNNGMVLVAGGTEGAELYDPDAGTWSVTGTMWGPRYSHTAKLLSTGKVLVLGGSAPQIKRSSVELYDPDTGVWSVIGIITTRRLGYTVTPLNGDRVLIAGGSLGYTSEGFPLLDSAEVGHVLTD